MAELKSPIDNTCSARLSQEEIQMPLSPVLGTGQSLKKLIKTRKDRHKRYSKKVVQKLENMMKPGDETDKKSNSVKLEDSGSVFNDDSILKDFEKLDEGDTIPKPSESSVFLDYNNRLQHMPENLLDRIQILEELETKKINVLQAISFSRTVDATYEPASAKSNNQPGRLNIENALRTNEEELFETHCKEIKMESDVCLKKVNSTAHFQTATGKYLHIPEVNMKKSARLFDDIMHPNNHEPCRKNKYNYLSKYGSTEKCSSKTLYNTSIRKDESTSKILYPCKDLSTDVTPLTDFAKIRNGKKNVQNTLESVNFDELNQNKQNPDRIQATDSHAPFKNNTKAESNFNLNVKDKVIEKKSDSKLLQLTNLQKPTKGVFEGECFDDLKLLENMCFKRASVNLKDNQSKENPDRNHKPDVHTSFKNTLEAESNFDLNFKDKAIEKQSDSKLLQVKYLQKPTKSVFEGECFDDLKLLQNIGFKTASSVNLKVNQSNKIPEGDQETDLEKSFKNTIEPASEFHLNFKDKVTEKISDSQSLQVKSLQKPMKNIFEDENFDDLRPLQVKGDSVSLKDNQNETIREIGQEIQNTQKYGRNIFKNIEDFDQSGFNSVSKLSYIKSESDLPVLQEKCLQKSVRNIFDSENFDDIKSIKASGFKTALASLKNEHVSKQHVSELHYPKNNMELDGFTKQTTQGFKKAMVQHKNIFEGENFDDIKIHNFPGAENGPDILKTTMSASLKVVRPKGFRNIFEEENFDDLKLGGKLGALGPTFQSPLSNSRRHNLGSRKFESPYRTPNKKIDEQTDIDNQSDATNFYGFNREEKELSLIISENNRDIVNIIEDRFKIIILQQNQDKSMVNLNDIANLSKKLYSNKLKLSIEHKLINRNNHFSRKRKYSELDSDHNLLCQNSLSEQNIKVSNSFLKRPKKKRLGCHFSPTIQISETVLKQAELIFEDHKDKPVNTSTPNKFNQSAASLTCDLTPIQSGRKNLAGGSLDTTKSSICGSFSRSFNKHITLDQTLIKNNARFSLSKPSKGNVNVWLDHLSSERSFLEEMLRIVGEKQTIFANQKTILEFSGRGKKRILPGVLFNSKRRKDRICLRDLPTNTQSDENATINFLNEVNPQNAHLVHFYMEHKRYSHLQTLDGAVVVPTSEGRIGISEIEHSFKVMESVDPTLIPKGWIQNHYKWIIWKLASYERMFPDKFEGALCVENVVQQLKFRYDMEIDQVKRSALHKIFEKDDCSQRRLVLCVSKIVKVNNTYELELTDGWYPIRTVIDPLLCDQILKGKIKLGVKLMMYGAELMNCEGCHPLEAIEPIYLKIAYNATRRTAWWAKLGCQMDSGPFLVPLSSVNLEGGKIGCIKCFVMRVYPVKYMEKYGESNVWRNRKAEERREQEFYNEKLKLSERTNSNLYKNDKNNANCKDTNGDVLKSIGSVYDPEILYEILQKNSDPETIQENLSCSQKTLLYNYAINKPDRSRSYLTNECNANDGTLQERSVTPLLKIKILDASCESDIAYDFHVWRPQDSHMQELTEGAVVTIFNVSCSSKWGLSANRTTQFKKEPKPNEERYQKFRRKITLIGELQGLSKETEFDTVGVVVKKNVGEHQQVWLSDSKENLLVIKIYESPKKVLVLDAVNEGQIVTVCNLVFKNFTEEYSFAMADHFVVFARYSQYRHLQEATGLLEAALENKDLSSLQQSCKTKVDKIETKWGCGTSKVTWDMDDMDCSQITTTDLALLECVDKLT